MYYLCISSFFLRPLLMLTAERRALVLVELDDSVVLFGVHGLLQFITIIIRILKTSALMRSSVSVPVSVNLLPDKMRICPSVFTML